MGKDCTVCTTEKEMYFGGTCVWTVPKKSNAGQFTKALKKLHGWIEEFEFLDRRTSDQRIISSIRKLFLMSREHSFTLQRDKYTCQRCGAKQSRAAGKEISVQVHHKSGDTPKMKIVEAIRELLLVDPDELETLCAGCHLAEGENFPPVKVY